MAGVLLGEDCGGGVETPVDREGGVDDRDAAVGLRMIVVITLINGDTYGLAGGAGDNCRRVGRESNKSMCAESLVRLYASRM